MELYLHFNKINSEGALNIIDGYRQNGKIRVLDLSLNSIGQGQRKIKMIDSLCRMIKNNCNQRNLLHIDLSYNYFKKEDGQ